MDSDALAKLANKHIEKLCQDITNRQVGSQGNHLASAYIHEELIACGGRVENQRFECLDFRSGDIHLSAEGKNFKAFISPYSKACDAQAVLALAGNISELRENDYHGKILLLYGELTREQLMPKNFVFYNPDSHQEIHRLLAENQPAAVITATARNAELAGAPYPFPMIEDGDFEIPTAYMTDVEGERLAKFAGKPAQLFMDAERIPSWAENVSGLFGPASPKRLVVCAHLDAKPGSPGAVDNGGGVAVLLLLAKLLGKTPQCPAVEILAINGEDHYSAGGEMAYLKLHEGKLDQIRLAINIDGAALRGYPDALSFYGTSPEAEEIARKLLDEFPTLEAGESWPQSDHMVFAMNQVPAMAITTRGFMEMEREFAHTAKDKPEIIDPTLLAEAVQFIYKLILALEKDVHVQ